MNSQSTNDHSSPKTPEPGIGNSSDNSSADPAAPTSPQLDSVSEKAAEKRPAGESAEEKSAEEKSFEEMSQEANVGLIREFVDFLKFNKKWWLTPIIAVLLLVGLLIILTTSGAAPFLYTFW